MLASIAIHRLLSVDEVSIGKVAKKVCANEVTHTFTDSFHRCECINQGMERVQFQWEECSLGND